MGGFQKNRGKERLIHKYFKSLLFSCNYMPNNFVIRIDISEKDNG